MDLRAKSNPQYSMFIFDDQARFKQNFAKVAQMHNFRVHSAHTQKRALAEVRSTIFDSYCFDISTPWDDVFGFDLIKIARKMNPDSYISVISAHDKFKDEVREIGADAFYNKPLKDLSVICDEAKKYVSNKHFLAHLAPEEIDQFLSETVELLSDNQDLSDFILSFFGEEIPELRSRVHALEFIAINSKTHIRQMLKSSEIANKILAG